MERTDRPYPPYALTVARSSLVAIGCTGSVMRHRRASPRGVWLDVPLAAWPDVVEV